MDGQPVAAEAGFSNEKTFSQASVHTPKFGTAVPRPLLAPSAAGCDNRPDGCLGQAAVTGPSRGSGYWANENFARLMQ